MRLPIRVRRFRATMRGRPPSRGLPCLTRASCWDRQRRRWTVTTVQSAGEYRLLTLTKRVKEEPLPACGVVDLRQELREGNRSILSRRLDGLMEQRLRAGEQTMLFINRRGVAGFVSCRACGHVIKCPHCDVSLSQHANGRWFCHYCGYTEPGAGTRSGVRIEVHQRV